MKFKSLLMRSFVLLITCALSFHAVAAQEFMGIEVKGKLSDVTAKLKEKGFKIVNSDDAVTVFSGKVAGSELIVAAGVTPISKQVWKIMVQLPEKTTWSGLKEQFNEYYSILRDKYGEPTDIYTEFMKPYYDGDGYEMTAIRNDKANYFARWDNGVWIEISSTSVAVNIHYENLILSDLKKQEQAKQRANVF
jgi:hypothetical protein